MAYIQIVRFTKEEIEHFLKLGVEQSFSRQGLVSKIMDVEVVNVRLERGEVREFDQIVGHLDFLEARVEFKPLD